MSRTAILNRLRRLAQPDEAAGDLPQFPEYANPEEQFGREFEAAGGIFFDARGGELERCLKEALRLSGAGEIVWEQEGMFERHGIACRLRDPLAFETGRLVYSQHPGDRISFPLLLHSRPWTRANLAAVTLSASSASYGIAETGTLLHEVGPGQGRLLSILPPAQIFFLSARDLVHNAQQLFSRWEPGPGSLATLVTGPSRTADIEKTLVIGVHGPRHCLAVLTD